MTIMGAAGAIFQFVVSAVMSLWNCIKSRFNAQGSQNEEALGTGIIDISDEGLTLAGAKLSWGDAAIGALGAAYLLNPSGTGHYVGKVGSSVVDSISDVTESALDSASSWLSKPIVWVGLGFLALLLLKD